VKIENKVSFRAPEADALLRMDAYAHTVCRGPALDDALASNRRLIAAVRESAIRDAALWLEKESHRVEASGAGWRQASVKINPDRASSRGIISFWNRTEEER
jgi:hypothetical protein